MTSDFVNFIKKSTLVLILFSALGFIFFRFITPDLYQKIFPLLLLFFYLLSLSLQYLLYKIAKMNMMKFSARFMGIIMLKMFLLLILALICILLNKEGAVTFIVVFFLLYVVFTVLEVQDIMKVTSKK